MTENFIDIDPHNLHEEWAKQASLFKYHADKLADAKEAVATAKAKMELAEAELANSIRKDPEAFGVDKVTESSIDAATKTQPSYQSALKRHIRARHEQDILQASVDALEHKKKALESLVHLHAMSYYSEPQVPKGVRPTLPPGKPSPPPATKKPRPVGKER